MKKVRNPLRTKTDKIRLGPLNRFQLDELLIRTLSKKDKGKITRHIKNLK